MATQVLKDKLGNKIGEIRDWGGKLAIYDKIGNRLGDYDAKTNVTKNKIGNKVGIGNLLTTLLKA